VSCDHDLREAFLFRALSGKSTLRADVIPLDGSICMQTSEVSGTEAVIPEKSDSETWSCKVRSRFKDIVESCQKLGSLFKKPEENIVEQTPSLLLTTIQVEELVLDDPTFTEEPEQKQEQKQEDEESASGKKDPDDREKEKEKEPEETPKIVSNVPPTPEPELAPPQVIVAPVATKISNEWREMLRMYELTVEELAELNERLQPHKTT